MRKHEQHLTSPNILRLTGSLVDLLHGQGASLALHDGVGGVDGQATVLIRIVGRHDFEDIPKAAAADTAKSCSINKQGQRAFRQARRLAAPFSSKSSVGNNSPSVPSNVRTP